MNQGPLILIIDDDDDIRTIVGRLFTAEGYRISEAADGVTAFDRARQIVPDLIVLDLGLPGQDGWTVAREMRADPALDQTPIMAVTAYGSSAALSAARSAGCQEVICKPFALDTLVNTARALLLSS
jgi:DNA-binding response OmpR family regulator